MGFTVLGLVKMVSYRKVLTYGFLYQILSQNKEAGFCKEETFVFVLAVLCLVMSN